MFHHIHKHLKSIKIYYLSQPIYSQSIYIELKQFELQKLSQERWRIKEKIYEQNIINRLIWLNSLLDILFHNHRRSFVDFFSILRRVSLLLIFAITLISSFFIHSAISVSQPLSDSFEFEIIVFFEFISLFRFIFHEFIARISVLFIFLISIIFFFSGNVINVFYVLLQQFLLVIFRFKAAFYFSFIHYPIDQNYYYSNLQSFDFFLFIFYFGHLLFDSKDHFDIFQDFIDQIYFFLLIFIQLGYLLQNQKTILFLLLFFNSQFTTVDQYLSQNFLSITPLSFYQPIIFYYTNQYSSQQSFFPPTIFFSLFLFSPQPLTQYFCYTLIFFSFHFQLFQSYFPLFFQYVKSVIFQFQANGYSIFLFGLPAIEIFAVTLIYSRSSHKQSVYFLMMSFRNGQFGVQGLNFLVFMTVKCEDLQINELLTLLQQLLDLKMSKAKGSTRKLSKSKGILTERYQNNLIKKEDVEKQGWFRTIKLLQQDIQRLTRINQIYKQQIIQLQNDNMNLYTKLNESKIHHEAIMNQRIFDHQRLKQKNEELTELIIILEGQVKQKDEEKRDTILVNQELSFKLRHADEIMQENQKLKIELEKYKLKLLQSEKYWLTRAETLIADKTIQIEHDNQNKIVQLNRRIKTYDSDLQIKDRLLQQKTQQIHKLIEYIQKNLNC